MNGWIGVDLDRTLAEYHGWSADGSIGKPIPAMVDRVKAWLSEGKDVRIFTARVWPLGTLAELQVDMRERVADSKVQLERVQDWCETHLGQPLCVTCMKDYSMVALWDDRAVQVVTNTGQRADGKAE